MRDFNGAGKQAKRRRWRIKRGLFRGRLPNSGYAVSAVWSEPTVYPFLGFPRTPFTRKGYAASVKRHSR